MQLEKGLNHSQTPDFPVVQVSVTVYYASLCALFSEISIIHQRYTYFTGFCNTLVTRCTCTLWECLCCCWGKPLSKHMWRISSSSQTSEEEQAARRELDFMCEAKMDDRTMWLRTSIRQIMRVLDTWIMSVLSLCLIASMKDALFTFSVTCMFGHFSFSNI